jgi:hypothetical protein
VEQGRARHVDHRAARELHELARSQDAGLLRGGESVEQVIADR